MIKKLLVFGILLLPMPLFAGGSAMTFDVAPMVNGVNTTSDQTITGKKTFNGQVVLSSCTSANISSGTINTFNSTTANISSGTISTFNAATASIPSLTTNSSARQVVLDTTLGSNVSYYDISGLTFGSDFEISIYWKGAGSADTLCLSEGSPGGKQHPWSRYATLDGVTSDYASFTGIHFGYLDAAGYSGSYNIKCINGASGSKLPMFLIQGTEMRYTISYNFLVNTVICTGICSSNIEVSTIHIFSLSGGNTIGAGTRIIVTVRK